LLHAEQHTKVDAEIYAKRLALLMLNAMLRDMTNTTEPVRCERCHRPLTSPASRARGKGDRCAAIEAAFDGLSDKQRDKARQLIIDGGVTRTSRKGIALVPSDETGGHYITSVTGHCTCAYGVRRKTAMAKTCYHVAVVVLEFTPRVRATASLFVLAA
jgi:hypothetical protein